MATHTRTFKIKRGHVTHCVTAGALGEYRDMPLPLLETIVRRRFELPASSNFIINYTDKNNDEVTIASDNDIYNACVIQDLNPVRLSVWLQNEDSSRSSAHDARPPNPLTVDPPPWAVVILLKLDQLLLAVKELKKPVVAPRGPTSTKIEDHFVVVDDSTVDDSPVDDSTLKKMEELFLVAGFGSESLKRATTLQPRLLTEEVSDVAGRGAESTEVFGSGSKGVAGPVAGPSTIAPNLEGLLGVGKKKGSGARKKRLESTKKAMM